ncbi:uncharacterized protein BX663DRAFT_431818 [Cokeromyces recurvatus]|uniref:uncharacterized protein n=1 Tax=Cokeromyces recurvatus TaxID=90255 RepID=UPI00221E94D9|nr:uncharacterized protein BX663DRAFT_431818 [Cokeromyces recurvatus]KAI7904127.1 hypothetical protein BX663DRAFT_431818 [Cokeromyces recurvatus]
MLNSNSSTLEEGHQQQQQQQQQQNEQIVHMAVDVIQQSIDLINRLNDKQYTFISKVMAGGTIGKHIRHVYDHFKLLYKQPEDLSIVNYDLRKPNNPSETERRIAINNLKELQKKIKEQSFLVPLEKELTLLAVIDSNDKQKYTFNSSFGRELLYCCIHAIHHYASIKAICIEQDISMPYEFGMAFSTLQS